MKGGGSREEQRWWESNRRKREEGREANKDSVAAQTGLLLGAEQKKVQWEPQGGAEVKWSQGRARTEGMILGKKRWRSVLGRVPARPPRSWLGCKLEDWDIF